MRDCKIVADGLIPGEAAREASIAAAIESYVLA
jgi:hypothetical protein